MSVTAIHNHIIFQFVDNLDANRQFREKTKSGIEIVGHFDNSAKNPRWANIIETGPDVDEVLRAPNCQILISNLMWTEGVKADGQTYWRTDDNNVLAYQYPEDTEE